LPRDLSGNYSRVIPPGASGYQPSTTISSAQVNAEINDIGAEITKSIDKTGATSPTNNLPMANFVHSGLGLADAAGETLRYEALGKGSDIAVIANGAVALPLEGALFNLTGASAFNVTGFTGRHDGRPFAIRFAPDKLLTLVNGANFKLLGGSNRITRAGEIINFVQESSGVITETGLQPIIDLTGYSGADIALGVGQSAIYTVAAITTLLLRVATGDNQRYEIVFMPDNVVNANATATVLKPNNTDTAAAAVTVSTIQAQQSTAVAAVATATNFQLDAGGVQYKSVIEAITRTKGKTVVSILFGGNATSNLSGTISNRWSDIAAVWSSLGTMVWGAAWTGLVQVTRKL